MLTLTRAREASGEAGEPLPTVFDVWAKNTIHIRQGQLALIAAAPGIGKSLVALTIAMQAKVPTYYFSADSDAFTMYIRAAAMLTGWRVDDIESSLKAGLHETIDAKLNGHDHIRFNFNASPSEDDIDEELHAFAATYGEWPRLVVVDNISNVWSETGGEGISGLDSTCDFLHERGRETGSAVIALHHVTGEYETGDKPVPLQGIKGKISKVPEQVITLNRTPGNEHNGIQVLNACPVKNRNGRSEPNGSWNLPLNAEMDRMRVYG